MPDAFPEPEDLIPDETGLVALGGVMTPALLIEAYSKGIFPWSGKHPIPWYSPDPRLVLDPRRLHRSRSLSKLIRRGRYEVRFDTDFPALMKACAKKRRRGQRGTWINGAMFEAYGQLARMHIAHSVESYEDGRLVGGLYGLALGRMFFGESMFADRPDASKVALSALCTFLVRHDFDLIDCQQETEHLMSLGAVAVSRAEFLRRLRAALARPGLETPWSL